MAADWVCKMVAMKAVGMVAVKEISWADL